MKRDNRSNNKELYTSKACEAKVIAESQCQPLQPTGRYGPLVARLPVIISKNKLDTFIETKICLDYPAAAIRACSWNAFITKCKLLDLGNKRRGKILFNGFIKEDIEYAAVNHPKDRQPRGDIRYKTVKLPFECCAEIDYCLRPVFKSVNRFISIDLCGDESCMPQGMHPAYNAFPGLGCGSQGMFCELEKIVVSKTEDVDVALLPVKDLPRKHILDSFTDYIVISVTFTLLQWQSVNISGYSIYNG